MEKVKFSDLEEDIYGDCYLYISALKNECYLTSEKEIDDSDPSEIIRQLEGNYFPKYWDSDNGEDSRSPSYESFDNAGKNADCWLIGISNLIQVLVNGYHKNGAYDASLFDEIVELCWEFPEFERKGEY